MFESLKEMDRRHWSAAAAGFLGWSLDAFDFFLMVFMFTAIAREFHAQVAQVAVASAVTLAARPFGALFFGLLADRFGRRPVLIVDVLAFSILELASAFSPNLTTLIVLRAMFGFAMGGEWGVGAALAFETLPAAGRGFFSGLLQEGYVIGFLLAAAASRLFFSAVGWRGMFVIGAVPALFVLYVVRNVAESPAWLAGRHRRRATAGQLWRAVRANIPVLLFMIVLMAFFNAFSHGSQDLYKTFLLIQRGLSEAHADDLIMIMNIGALLGGIFFGSLSERLGRRKAIAVATALALPVIPLWAYAPSVPLLALGAFLMQFMVQGAWGIVPAHLNELSPPGVRAMLPGFAYQLGNFAVALLAPVQARIAEQHGNDYASMLAWTLGIVAIALILVTLWGTEAKSVAMTEYAATEE